MWMLRLKTGLELTEKELSYWDNLPNDIEIKALALTIPRPNGQSFILEVTGYEEICCATLGSASLGGTCNIAGRIIFCVKDQEVSELKLTNSGISLKSYPRDKLELRPSCLRRMVE